MFSETPLTVYSALTSRYDDASHGPACTNRTDYDATRYTLALAPPSLSRPATCNCCLSHLTAAPGHAPLVAPSNKETAGSPAPALVPHLFRVPLLLNLLCQCVVKHESVPTVSVPVAPVSVLMRTQGGRVASRRNPPPHRTRDPTAVRARATMLCRTRRDGPCGGLSAWSGNLALSSVRVFRGGGLSAAGI
jgi:hypothetical protein